MADGKTLASVNPARVGLLGFSLGGNLCLELRCVANVLVSFFAPAQRLSPSGSHPSVHAQLHNGGNEHFIAPEIPAAIEGLLAAEHVIVESKPYAGAGHGFIGTDPATTTARTKSKASTLSFFTDHL